MNKLYLSRSRISFLLLLLVLIVSPSSYAANERMMHEESYGTYDAILKTKITISVTNQTISQILDQISKQYKIAIFQNNNQKDLSKRVSLKVHEATLGAVLDKLIEGTTLGYKVENKQIVIYPDPAKNSVEKAGRSSASNVQSKYIELSGVVVDQKGEPLIAVNIHVVGTTKGISTDEQGRYTLKLPSEGCKIKYSYIGYNDVILTYSKSREKQFAKVVMSESANNLNNIVVTGYFTKTKASLTGSQVMVKGDELRQVGSMNFMQALSAFEPSIRTVPNTEFGSDPNRVPEITIRGENGFDLRSSADDSRSNPNAPLYILDGIEVSATRVYDLDMNRIESFVILKDASATSLYGSRGANGVILISTIPPKEGKIKVTTNMNYTLSTPDLRDYNLMNSAEKLEYERLAGVYTSRTSSREEQIELDVKYSNRLAEVMRGVDTYWLSKPLRTSLNQRYNAFIEGGDASFRYGITLTYDNNKGVMKGSGREKYGINVSFNYNIGRKFIIKNDVTINDIEGYNSPYGAFSVYAMQNPNERLYDRATGELIRTFEYNNSVNPMVNATLPNIDKDKYTEFQDNFNMDWRINDNFRITGRASFTKTLGKTEKYLSPLSSTFDKETDANKKGSYTTMNKTDLRFDGNITASYNKTLFQKFSTNIGVGANVTTSENIGDGYTATGFLSDNMRFVQYAQQFKENSKPTGMYDKARLIGFFANANIGYENRYFVDMSFRTDGSSRFGRDSRFAPFWAVGAAWNVNKESWWKGDATLKLRSSVGSTGSVNFSADQAITKYRYSADYEYNGVYGAQLLGYGNPALRWQNTLQYNVGLDLTMWKNIVVFNIDAYIKQTQNLLLPIDVAPSTGFSSYTENLGSMENKGLDMRLRFNIIRDIKRDLNWNVTFALSHNKNKIKNLSNALEAMNEEANSNESVTGPRPLRTYQAGRSQSALMVVESLGIDPATGNEIFRKLNGDLTFVYDPKDKVIVGDTNPLIQGTIQSNLTFKGFNLYVVLAYEYGAKIYNSTLAQKVEGSSPLYNADKRVLYDRWKKPGDIALFKRIDDTSSPFQTTRLVQDNDFIRLQTLSLSYDVPKKYLEKIFIERAKVIFSTSDLFRLSTVRIERGTSYPFAQTYSLAFNLTF